MSGVKHFREQAENELVLESKMYLKEMLYGKMWEKVVVWETVISMFPQVPYVMLYKLK